ncbi:hypothetical protein AY599_10600 [Leptolyngbya valderiana BDU 20041]|nr:hypothetical protein AY599_10600 [Leptolyngbya valderiana BDU 20041]
MEHLAERTDYTLRDPAALGALLIYDWRLRGVFTDDELIASLQCEITTSILRSLQRTGLVRALHGVRPQGGRMRLWTMTDALKLQAALDLRRITGAKLSACADVILAHENALAPVFEDWRSLSGTDADAGRAAMREGDAADLLTRPEALKRVVAASAGAYVSRNRFTEVSAPAFLL